MLSIVMSTILRRISSPPPFGPYGAQVLARTAVHLVHEAFGLGFGAREVEPFVVEAVLDEGVVELVKPVRLQFVHVNVRAVLETGVEVEQPDGGRQRGEVGGTCRGLPPPAREAVGAHDVAPEEIPRDHERHEHDSQRHRHDGVGLHDVAHHLVRIDQVIHGDEVVAYAELVPEEVLAHAVEYRESHAEDDDQREPYRCPVAPDSGQEEPQGERGGPIAQYAHCDLGRDAAVFVEDRIEERHVAECCGEYAQRDISPRTGVFRPRDAHREEPQEGESHGRGAEVVHGAQEEDFAPFAECESRVGRLCVERQDDAQEQPDDDGQQGEFEIEAGNQPDAFLHIVSNCWPYKGSDDRAKKAASPEAAFFVRFGKLFYFSSFASGRMTTFTMLPSSRIFLASACTSALVSERIACSCPAR